MTTVHVAAGYHIDYSAFTLVTRTTIDINRLNGRRLEIKIGKYIESSIEEAIAKAKLPLVSSKTRDAGFNRFVSVVDGSGRQSCVRKEKISLTGLVG